MGRGIKIKVKCGCCKRWVYYTFYNTNWGYLIPGLTCKRCSTLLDTSPEFRAPYLDKRKKERVG